MKQMKFTNSNEVPILVNVRGTHNTSTRKRGGICYDIIFCVFGCATIQKYKNEIQKINETWGLKANLNNKVLFFLGEEKTELVGEEYIYLNGVYNDYMSASYKQNLGLKYIYEHYDCNFIYICGTDTFINIEVLQKYLENKFFPKDDNFCIGGDGDIRNIIQQPYYFHSGGPGMILSYKALSEIYPQLENMVSNWNNIVSKEKKTRKLICACDVAICYYLKQIGCVFIKEDSLFFNCNNDLGFPCSGLKTKFIACHNISLSDFDNFFFELYE